MPFIIDGYNLLWSIQKTGADFEAVSEIGLCRIISRYLVLTADSGEVVFDGTGPPDKGAFDNLRKLEVSFSGQGLDADSVIENKIKASTAPKRLTVVSDDRRIRSAARARKAIALKNEAFWSTVITQLNRKKTLEEPAAKRDGISESETKEWLRFFGLEE